MIKQEYKWLTDTFVAHRGLFNNVDIPENSIPAFAKARENNFGIELDVQMSSDGVLVVFHDDNLKRMTGKDGLLCEHTFEQLRELRLLGTNCQIPTFEEFLQAAGGVNLVVEIKTHKNIGELEQKVVDALANYNGNYCIESFDPFVVRWFKVNAPHIIRGQLSTDFKNVKMAGWKKFLLKHLVFCKWNGSQFIAYDAECIDKVKAVKRFGKKVPILCWTIRSQEQYESLKGHFENIIFDSFMPIRYDLEK